MLTLTCSSKKYQKKRISLYNFVFYLSRVKSKSLIFFLFKHLPLIYRQNMKKKSGNSGNPDSAAYSGVRVGGLTIFPAHNTTCKKNL